MKSAWACSLLLLAACRNTERAPSADGSPSGGEPGALTTEFTDQELRRILSLSPLPQPPADPTNAVYENPQAARFGQFLFHDTRLSGNGSTACTSCHDVGSGWADGQALSKGVAQLDRNALSLWNVAHNRWFFWDGRADSLWSQALVPLEHPLEHATSRLQIAHTIFDAPELREAYEALFGALPDLADTDRFPATGRPVSERELAWIEDLAKRNQEDGLAPEHHHRAGVHFIHPHQRAWDTMSPKDQESVTRIFTNVGKSIAAFERQIVAGQSAFDRFVEGLRTGDESKITALDASGQRGLKLFVGRGRCHICHQGPTFSDREFHDIGIAPSAAVRTRDRGRLEGLAQLQESPFKATGPWSDDPDGAGRERIGFLPSHAHGAGAEFKTPSLRNVAVTAPYMHQGQMPTLDSVLEHYSTVVETPENVLTPLHLTHGERHDLIQFLTSLTDTELETRLRVPPASPH